MKITLIRHGKTKGNIEKRYIGSTDESLCPLGIEQAQNFKDAYMPADKLYSSPMKRAIETAKILFENTEIIIENDFREMDFGDFENKNYEELCNNSDYRAFVEGANPANGEDKAIFFDRCFNAFLNIISFHKDNESIAIVCHGGTIMAILHKLTNKEFYTFQSANLSGYELNFENSQLISYKEVGEIHV